jgi:hypothetical protein
VQYSAVQDRSTLQGFSSADQCESHRRHGGRDRTVLVRRHIE